MVSAAAQADIHILMFGLDLPKSLWVIALMVPDHGTEKVQCTAQYDGFRPRISSAMRIKMG